MLNISYTLSPKLKATLDEIEKLRIKLLLTPLPVKLEMRLRWEATISKIYWALVLKGTAVNKSEIMQLCLGQVNKRLNSEQEKVLKYKKGLEYIFQEWLVNQKAITPKTVITLFEIACFGKLRVSEKTLKELLDYLQTSSEHPVIQASLAHNQLEQLQPFTKDNKELAQLVAYLFLYKNGFDLKGMLVLEEYFRKDQSGYTIAKDAVFKTGKVTIWIEYFAEALRTQLQKKVDEVLSGKIKFDTPSKLWELNNRQKQIIFALDPPDGIITNRGVQKMFRVSQITASRDLGRLANLGMLYAHGKGRSIYYTRA